MPIWLEPAFTIAGGIAIVAWLGTAVWHFISKSRELRQIDADINTALRDALNDMRAARLDDKESLQNRLSVLAEQIQATEKKLERESSRARDANRMANVGLLAFKVIVTIAKGRPRDRMDEASNLVRVIGPSLKGDDTTRRASMEALLDLYALVIREATYREETYEIMAFMLKEATDHPALSVGEIFERYKASLKQRHGIGDTKTVTSGDADSSPRAPQSTSAPSDGA